MKRYGSARIRTVKRGTLVSGFTVAVLMAAGGCGAPAGDGDIADDWAGMASASPRVPPASACYTAGPRAWDAQRSQYHSPTACTASHGAETFHSGQLPASVTAYPAENSPAYLQAHADCDKRAREFLGGDWFAARLYLSTFVPSPTQWDGGARWYVCQLLEVKGDFPTTVVPRTASLRNAFAAVAHGCVDVPGLATGGWYELTPIDCAQPHEAEYAGSFLVTGVEYPRDQEREVYKECRNVVAQFVGAPVSQIRVGYVPWGLQLVNWRHGHRYARCFAWSDRGKTVGTMKGLGNRAPKVV
jgi:hypothetical protein